MYKNVRGKISLEFQKYLKIFKNVREIYLLLRLLDFLPPKDIIPKRIEQTKLDIDNRQLIKLIFVMA